MEIHSIAICAKPRCKYTYIDQCQCTTQQSHQRPQLSQNNGNISTYRVASFFKGANVQLIPWARYRPFVRSLFRLLVSLKLQGDTHTWTGRRKKERKKERKNELMATARSLNLFVFKLSQGKKTNGGSL